MSSVQVGWARLALPSVSRWMKEANGKMKFGRIIARNAVLNYRLRASEHTPWLLERRNGLARGIYSRLVEDYRFSRADISGEVQWCLNTMLSSSGFSVYQMVFGSNPVDIFGWEAQDKCTTFAQIPSISGQFAQQRKLRVMAQGASLKEVANSQLRR